MTITIITAIADNNIIGINNRIPWHIPEDLQHFYHSNVGKTCVMGRKTWESLPNKLHGRHCVILSSKPPPLNTDAEFIHSIEQINTEEEIMIIGGQSIYEQFLPISDTLIITNIKGSYEGDAKFPEYERNDFNLIHTQKLCDSALVEYLIRNPV